MSSTHATTHLKHKGERWLLTIETNYYEGLRGPRTTFTASNHGDGSNVGITESYWLTSDEFIELMQKHGKDTMLKEPEPG